MTFPGDEHDPNVPGSKGHDGPVDGEPEAPADDLSNSQPAGTPADTAVAQDAPPAPDPADPPRPRWQFWRKRSSSADDEPPTKKSLAREIPILIIIALVLALLIKSFVVQPFYIPSGSMEQTLKIDDRVLVNKMIYHFRDVKRGEIVVFNIEGTGFAQYATPLAAPTNIVSRAFRNLENLFGLGPNNKDFIKRVIAIGGDTVACCDSQGRVTVNGKALDEPYVYRDGPDEQNKRFGPVKIAKGNLWVMGDHRNDSEDSRVAGQFPQSKVIGQAFVRVWPITQWRGFGVPKTFAQLKAGGGVSAGLLLPFWWRRRRRSWSLPVLPGPTGRKAE
jgi:signal peptidase I